MQNSALSGFQASWVGHSLGIESRGTEGPRDLEDLGNPAPHIYAPIPWVNADGVEWQDRKWKSWVVGKERVCGSSLFTVELGKCNSGNICMESMKFPQKYKYKFWSNKPIRK
jgi:hypothetical protein